MPTTLAVTGNYGQMTSFINGLDQFPRLFVIQTFNLAFGSLQARPSAGRLGAAGSSGRAAGARATGSAPVGRWHADLAVGRPLQPVHRRFDLLHHDPERPGRVHQGHRDSPLTSLRCLGELGGTEAGVRPR